MDDKEVSGFRSEVIEKFVLIEQLVDIAISFYFFGYRHKEFESNILYDDGATFGFKCRVLQKTCSVENIHMQDLYRLNKIRNIFAHINHVRIAQGKEVNYDPRDMEEINFSELYAEFLKKGDGIISFLMKVVKEKELETPASLKVLDEETKMQLSEKIRKITHPDYIKE